MRLRNVPPGVPGLPVQGDVYVDFEKIGGFVGAQYILRIIRIRYQLAGNNIDTCAAESLALLSDGCDLVGAVLNGTICENPYIGKTPPVIPPASIDSEGDITAPALASALVQGVFTDVTAGGGAQVNADRVTSFNITASNIVVHKTEGRKNSTDPPGSVTGRIEHQGTLSIGSALLPNGRICDEFGANCVTDWNQPDCDFSNDFFIRRINANGTFFCGKVYR